MNKLLNKTIHRLRLASRVLIRGEFPRRERAEIPGITQEEVSEARSFFPLDKFFIFGHARSGTTLLTRLVRLHSDVHCNYQGHFFTRQPTIESLVNSPEVEAWLTRRSNRWNHSRDLSPVVLRSVVDFIMEREARPLGVKVVGDKSPNSLMDGDAVLRMHKVYPDGKLVFIVRDGRDASISHRFQTFIDATQHLSRDDWAIRSDFQRNPEFYLRGERSIFTEGGIRSAAAGWVKNVCETDQAGKKLFGPQYQSLRYEDLLADPWEVMVGLWNFLGVPVADPGLRSILEAELSSNPDKDWQREKAGSLVEPLQKGKSGSWQDLFTKRDRVIFKEIAADTLITWRYESDTGW